MRGIIGTIAATGVLAVLLALAAPEARAQGAIGFQPAVTPFSDGVFLNTTPVVSADRRYVRLGVNTSFQTLQGVQPFGFTGGAVSGGGVGGLGGVGGIGGLGGAGGVGGLGAVSNVGGGAAVVPGLGAVGPIGGLYGWPGFYGGYPYGIPGYAVAGYPQPFFTGPIFPPQTVNTLGIMPYSFMNAVAPGSWRMTFP